MLFKPHRPLLFFILLFLMTPTLARAVFGDNASTNQNPILKSITIEGNSKTETNAVLREMDLIVGQPFNREMMNKAWEQLEDVGYFAFVDMEFNDSQGDGVVLDIYVEEDLTRNYGPLARYSRRHKYLLGVWLEENNLRGKGESLRIDLAAFYIQQGEISWTHPWWFGVRGLQLKLGLKGENSNFVFRPTKQRLSRADVEVRWNILGELYVATGLNHGLTNYLDNYNWVDAATDSRVLHSSGTVNQLATRAALGFDSRNNPWYPAHGVFAEVQAQHWSGDDFDSYSEFIADLRVFIPVPIAKHVLALHAWGRQTDGSVQLDNTLFFGGPETIRGYRFGGLEGDEGYLLSAEYRIPLFMMPISPKGEMVGMGLHVFGDAGDAWYDFAEAGRALQSWGGGIHVNIDRMQLRFEGAKTRDGEWVFEFMDHFNF